MPSNPGTTVANDALLAQLVRSSLSRHVETCGLSRPNVSSCSFIITLPGCVRGPEERQTIEEAVRRVLGVRDVVNKMKVAMTF